MKKEIQAGRVLSRDLIRSERMLGENQAEL